ncbi:hypothetical protein ABG768_019062 [Culter alburnus]|uniref:Uncharacterized protein n=1 Tax=Culter alburnus TaxID=194366 RepID=A0AAW2AU09_CULAL
MDDRIRFYFDQGLTQTEIALCLSVIDNFHISVRHLRRRLSDLQLYRRRQYSDPERVVSFIASQLEGPGRLHGYRMMFERCRLNGLRLTREMVREVQLSLDPLGVEERRGRRLQEFLREDSTGTLHGPCVFQGTSPANQRIENYWMDMFKELQSTGDFTGDATDKCLIRFCFLSLIQDELDTVVNMWNNHRIRRSNGCDLQHGKPFLMYNLPELYQSKDYLNPVDAERLDVINHENVCLWKSDIPCDRDFYDLCILVMEENNLQPSAAATLSGTETLQKHSTTG